MAVILFLVFSLFLQGALGDIVCEELPVGLCTFSVASSGKRCLLETQTSSSSSTVAYQCKTSEVVVKNMPEWIESDACIGACGVDRYSVGISSDSLLEPLFTAKLCAPACYLNCPNIVDLYYKLALAEGVFLPGLCKDEQTNPRRSMMAQIRSSGSASGPVSAAAYGPASASAAGPPLASAAGPAASTDFGESLESLACAPAAM